MSYWVSNGLNTRMKTTTKQIEVIESFVKSVVADFNLEVVSLEIDSIKTDEWNEKALKWVGTIKLSNSRNKVRVYGYLTDMSSVKNSAVSVHDFKSGKVYIHPLSYIKNGFTDNRELVKKVVEAA